MAAPKKISWSKRALTQFEKAYIFIFEDSNQNAEKVRKDILEKIGRVAIYPESCSPEKYKENNDGSYRYFEKHRLRITYRIKPGEIWIVRVRHTSMKPKSL